MSAYTEPSVLSSTTRAHLLSLHDTNPVLKFVDDMRTADVMKHICTRILQTVVAVPRDRDYGSRPGCGTSSL